MFFIEYIVINQIKKRLFVRKLLIVQRTHFSGNLRNYLNKCLFSGSKYRKLKALYSKMNGRVENWSKIINLILAKIVPICLTLPNAIFSFFNYFATDLGNDAFVLTIPTW